MRKPDAETHLDIAKQRTQTDMADHARPFAPLDGKHIRARPRIAGIRMLFHQELHGRLRMGPVRVDLGRQPISRGLFDAQCVCVIDVGERQRPQRKRFRDDGQATGRHWENRIE